MVLYSFLINGAGYSGYFCGNNAAKVWAHGILEKLGYNCSNLVWSPVWDSTIDGKKRLLVWLNPALAKNDAGQSAIGQLVK